MSKSNADTVAERRLRPIYDWLDNGNNKKAIQEADKVLKKQPDLLCAKVLKGLALLRLGRSKDCEDILDNVKKEVPYDDCTLQAMTICYREIHKLEKICDVYEKALLKDPYNEELNTHLFMAYVRVGDYKKQQQVALNLYKIKPKNPYYFWGVMSILMQAQINDENIAQKVTLPLAERMVKKFIDEGKIEAEQEVQLYLMILEMQKKYKEALEMIDSKLGEKVLPYYIRSRKRIKLLKALEMWQDLNDYIKTVLLEEPDAFVFYVTYIESVFKLMQQGNISQENDTKNESYSDDFVADSSSSKTYKNTNEILELCISFIKECQENSRIKQRKLRGPYLASFILYEKLTEENYDPEQYLGTAYDLFKTYFKLFAEKACCFKDIYMYLPFIKSEYKNFLEDTLNIIKQNDSVPSKKQAMYLTYFQLHKFFSNYDEMYSVDDKILQISELINFYNMGHQYNEHMTNTDLGYNDTFMILVAHILYDLYLSTNDYNYIKDAICLLEYSFKYSISSHHFKLLLLKFYNLLGATKAGYKYFQLLEIKHMQYDSLGYLSCWPLLYSGQYTLAVHLLDNTLKFFNVNYKEAADQLTHAYKYGSFEKVNEFLNFREKLKNSFHYSLVTIEHLMHDITHLPSHEATIQTVQHISINPEKSTVSELDHLVDNRDLYLFLNFDPYFRRMNEEYAKLSFDHEVSLIRLRTMILRCIGASVNVSLYTVPIKSNHNENLHANSNGVDDSSVKHLDVFLSVIEELRELNKTFSEHFPAEIPKNVFSGIDESRLFLYLKSTFFLPFLIDAMSFAHHFCCHCLINNNSVSDDKIEQTAEIVAERFSSLLSSCNDKIGNEVTCRQNDRKELFEFLSLIVEIFCISCIICGNLHSVLSMTNKIINVPVRRRKKKGGKEIMNEVEANDKDQNEKRIVKIFRYFLKMVQDNINLFDIYLTRLESCWSELKICKPKFELQRLDQLPSDKKICENDPILGISDKKWFYLQTEVYENLKESYRSSVQEIRSMVKQKIDYLMLLSF